MSGLSVLFDFAFKKRIKDSFLIGYGVMFPLILITILGYMGTNYYSGENGITSYYYYTMVLIPFCTFLGSVTFVYVSREESEAKCGERFIIAPIDKKAIILSKIIPATIVTMMYNFILMIVCRFLFKINFCGRFLEIYLLYAALGFMSCAIGTFIGFCTRDFMQIKNFISTPILIMAVLGGTFFPIGSLGGIVEKISYISPLTWINRAIFLIMKDNRSNIYTYTLSLVLVIGVIFVLLAIKKFKKEVYL